MEFGKHIVSVRKKEKEIAEELEERSKKYKGIKVKSLEIHHYLNPTMESIEYTYCSDDLKKENILSQVDLLEIKNNFLYERWFNILNENINVFKNIWSILEAYEYICVYLSLENYAPMKTEKIFKRILKEMHFDSSLPYSAPGYFGLMKLDKSKRKHYKEYQEFIGRVLDTQATYYIFNSDWSRLEKFISKHSRNINSEKVRNYYQILIKAGIKKEIPLYDFAKIVIGDDDFPPSPQTSGWCYFKLDPVVDDYFKKNAKKDYLQGEIIKDFMKFLKRKPKSICSIAECPREELHYNIAQYFELVTEGKVRSFPNNHILRYGLDSIDTHIYFFDLVREYQNSIRKKMGVPNIGEGWVSEIKLLENVRQWFAEYTVTHQWSPDWLGPQRIDVGIEELNIAIEYHGTQHYKPVEFFGGKEAFEKQKERDQRKKELCDENFVQLLVFNKKHTDEQILKTISKAVIKAIK